MAALQREVASLRGRVPATGSRASEEAARTSGTTGSVVPIENAEPRTPDEVLAIADHEGEQRVAFLREAMRGERRDVLAERALTYDMQELLDRPESPELEIIRIECTRTLCEIETRHDDRSAARAIFHSLPTSEMLRGEGFLRYVENDDGSFSSTYFVAREGHELPHAAADLAAE